MDSLANLPHKTQHSWGCNERVDYAPGGINPPHSHPRATESGVVIQGQLLVGFVTTQNVFYSKVLSVGEMFGFLRDLYTSKRMLEQGRLLPSQLSTVTCQGLSSQYLSLLQNPQFQMMC
uniref:Germin-like protein n=1 Tax=Fagus sylvatica TaxID=28930 RepID=A0A2N9G7G0_FAGSY